MLVYSLMRLPTKGSPLRWLVMALPAALLLWMLALVGVPARNRMAADAFDVDSFGAQLMLVVLASLVAVGTVGVTAHVRSYLSASRAQLETEARFRRVFDSARNGLVLLNDEGELLEYNAAMLELVGYDQESIEKERAELGRYLTISDFMAEDELVRLWAMASARLRGDETPDSVETRMRHRDGHWIDIEASASVFLDGDTMGVLTEVRDISEQLQMREQLLRSQKLEAVGTLVSGVAHNFNNLLTTIGGSIELAGDTDDKQPWLERASVATDRVARLVEQLLQFSRHDAAEHAIVDLRELADESIELLRETIDHRIELKRGVDGGPLLVWADRGQLHQVVMNVLVNASDALDERLAENGRAGYRAQITVEFSTTRAGMSEIRVIDNGPGIAPEIRNRIFDPFFTTKAIGRSSGLGLSTAYGIVTQHGGQMSVQSTVGEGTEVSIGLPPFTGAASEQQEPAPPSAAVRRDRGGRLLIVDDEPALVAVAHRTLQDAGYDVVSVGSGREALEIASMQRFDLILLDVNMPAPNGWEALDELLDHDPGQRVLMLSGNALGVEARRRGARGLLMKPYDRDSLVAAVDAALPVEAVVG
ncbi:MAG: response regulator [Dehalococcoidia bacterium]